MGPIVLFDGVCNLCNGSVKFIIRRDAAKVFKFASLQSEAGRTILSEHGFGDGAPDSVVLIEDGVVSVRSDASIGIAAHLGAPWSWLTVLRLVPRRVRDAVYGIVARSRYTIFGKRDECMLPGPELRDRFLG